MPLLSPADQERLRASFTEMTSPVRLLFFTQTLDCDTCSMTKQILDELPPLSDKITIDEVNFVLEKDKAAQYGIDRVPAIALAGAESDSRIRFLGACGCRSRQQNGRRNEGHDEGDEKTA